MLARTRILIPVIFAVLAPLSAFAALVNINTATADELDALPGIGPSKATAIVQYRTDHGPFASITDIQNVSGIGPSIYADIAPLITVGGGVPADSGTHDESAQASSTPASSGGASAYVPPPQSLTVDAGADLSSTLDMPVTFVARVRAPGGSTDSAARMYWSFGDGSSAEGNPVEKTYQFAGTYLVHAEAQDGSVKAGDDVMVTVAPAQVRVAEVSSAGVTLENDADLPLDLSDWRLTVGGSSFRFPRGTEILPHMSVLFPQLITNLPVGFDAFLSYPNGLVAARYAAAQPQAQEASSSLVQTVGSVSPTSLSVTAHAKEAIIAPVPTPLEAAGAGAAFATEDLENASTSPAAGQTGLLHSPWLYGLLGVLTVAGGAFLIL